MGTRDDVVRYIRFQLAELRARNAQHIFEDICRELARKRIASNILPATGPVGAGGDQGRDFETFRSYINGEELPRTPFRALVQDKDIAFLCTLQAHDVPAKIREDLKVVHASGYRPTDVYAFCEANVPVGVRHTLQTDAKAKYGLALEILDGESIADHLGDRDTFWIAETYLGIPLDIFPVAELQPQWYEQSKARWAGRRLANLTIGEFSDVKDAIRHATRDPEVQPDIPFWIDVMKQFEQPDALEELRRAAFYEIVVASLMGTGTLARVDNELPAFFSAAAKLRDVHQLEDARVLVTFVVGALRRGLTSHAPERVQEWRLAVKQRCEEVLLEPDVRGGEECSLMESIAFLSIPILEAEGAPMTAADLDAAFSWWKRLVIKIPKVPLFPIESMSKYLAVLAPVFSVHPDYRPLISALDDVVAKQAGRSAAAALCRDRAIAFKKANQLTAALAEFHKAKVDWFTGDTVRGSILSMALIGECYRGLGLDYAAKYYDLGTAWGAMNAQGGEHQDLARPALMSAAMSIYYAGSWLTFLEWSFTALGAHLMLATDAGNLAEHEDLQILVTYLTIVYIAGQRLMPADISAWLEAKLHEMKLFDVVHDLASEHENPWTTRTGEEIAKQACAELNNPPFADAGAGRTMKFTALGLRWMVYYGNDYQTLLTAERFTAILQVIVADLAKLDLLLLPSIVEITVELASGGLERVVVRPSNSSSAWFVRLSPYDPRSNTPTTDDASIEAIAAVTEILATVSLMRREDFLRQLERMFQEGIRHKVTPGNLYDRLYATFLPEDTFAQIPRGRNVPLHGQCPEFPEENGELAWVSRPGPGYSRARSDEFNRNRYRRTVNGLGSLPSRLARDQRCRALISKLRDEGWLDWQILSAVLNVIWNYRVEELHLDPTSKDTIERLSGDLSSGSSIPLAILTEEALRNGRIGNLLAGLKTWDLEIHQETPDLLAIEKFMTERYGWQVDDVPHPDPFSGEQTIR